MSDNRFPIRGTTVPPMLGRDEIIEQIMRALTKATPDHIQMVGPVFAGKTVILQELHTRLQKRDTQYSAVVYWDLRHNTPDTDELFMQGLTRELAIALKATHKDYSDHLKDLEDNPYLEIVEVLNALKVDGCKVLVIMDSFEYPLSFGQLSRNLWDQLLDLARKPSCTLITASRRSLYELLKSKDSQTSEFWGIFDTKISVGCFNSDDLAKIVASINQLQFKPGAKTELLNTANGFPILTLSILNAICREQTTGLLSPETIQTACGSSFSTIREIIDVLWEDCTTSSQDLLLRVKDEDSVSRVGIVHADSNTLIERGFVQSAGNKLQKPSRLLCKYLDEQPNEGNALFRLFSENDNYKKNLKSVLERRINQIERIDPDLRQFLMIGVGTLPNHPRVFLSNVHGILEQALTLIWKAECWDTDYKQARVPLEWITLWEKNGENPGGIAQWKRQFPEGGQRIRLLHLITGTQNTDRLARFVTKNTYVLANSVQGFRDFGVHPKSENINIGTAYAALNDCIELAACLSSELENTHRQFRDR